jgi:hypothetical protein
MFLYLFSFYVKSLTQHVCYSIPYLKNSTQKHSKDR